MGAVFDFDLIEIYLDLYPFQYNVWKWMCHNLLRRRRVLIEQFPTSSIYPGQPNTKIVHCSLHRYILIHKTYRFRISKNAFFPWFTVSCPKETVSFCRLWNEVSDSTKNMCFWLIWFQIISSKMLEANEKTSWCYAILFWTCAHRNSAFEN